jgi:23S rRNA pseudouridine1911/1915/1917 synthase
VQRWIREGRVEIDGASAKPAATVAPGDRVCCRIPAATEDRVEPEPGDLTVLYEDRHLIVLDKPAGLTVHPGTGRPTGTLAHRLMARYPELAGIGGPGRPGIVHRLDHGTSGAMVVARTPEAYQKLARAFASRAVGKTYVAVVYGAPAASEGRIEAPIARHPARRREMAVVEGGRPALTLWRRLAAASGVSLLALDLATGRTHQIRVHLKSIGHPLVGDAVYGEARWKGLAARLHGPLRAFPRPALHAWRLAFEHPADGRPLAFTAAVPEDLRKLWEDVAGRPIDEALALFEAAAGPRRGSG